MEGEDLIPHYYGMARVVAAVVANDHIRLSRTDIHYTTFAFISPLCSHDYCAGHFLRSPPKV